MGQSLFAAMMMPLIRFKAKMRHYLPAFLLVSVAAMGLGGEGPAMDRRSIVNGRNAVRGLPPMNPPLWSMVSYQNVWKQWRLKERPGDFAGLFQKRYGLHRAPYDNQGLPMGFHLSPGLLGKGLVTDCLLCHAGRIAGQTVIGLGNASLDLQTLFEDFSAAESFPFKYPMSFSHVRGTVDPVSPVAFLMGFRDLDLKVQKATVSLTYFDNVCSDPPAWWLLKKKKTRDWTGGIDARSTRIDMVNLLTPFNGPQKIKKHEATFADIHAFLLSIEAPRYPFPINRDLAEQGHKIFVDSCSRCHGTYGPGGKYPNKIVPLDKLGTDRTLAQAVNSKNLDYINKSWLTREKGPAGTRFQVKDTGGYQAPPLDGVWATAPYFHNGSVPTIYHVLNSRDRPKIFTRSYGTEKADYDPIKVGWKITVLEQPPSPDLPAALRRKIYDSHLPGRHNTGHTFGDDLTGEERTALIEYLKTL